MKKQDSIDVILSELPLRMQNLKKYSPFFDMMKLNTLSEKYQDKDIAGTILAILNYLLVEGKLKERGIGIEEIEKFVFNMVEKKYDKKMDANEIREFTIYLMLKITCEGKRFEYTYYDTDKRAFTTEYIRYVEYRSSQSFEDDFAYYITSDGIDFVLQTKEFGEESKVTIYLLLLKKQLENNDFEGVYNSVIRINTEIQKQIDFKREIVDGLRYSGKEGFERYLDYVEKSYKKLKEEESLFNDTDTLIKHINDDYINNVSSNELRSVQNEGMQYLRQASTELFRTIEKHSRLLKEIVSLKTDVLDIQKENRKKVFKGTFDFNRLFIKCIEKDSVESLKYILNPLFNIHINKNLNINRIRDMFTFRSTAKQENRIIDEPQNNTAENTLTMSQVVDKRLIKNFRLYMEVLLFMLKDCKEVSLKDYIEKLKNLYGEDSIINTDFFAFIMELNKGKSEINSVKKYIYTELALKKHKEKACEFIFLDTVKNNEELSFFKQIPLEISALSKDYIAVTDGFAITNFIFRR